VTSSGAVAAKADDASTSIDHPTNARVLLIIRNIFPGRP
jgi:hypothetical protein